MIHTHTHARTQQTPWNRVLENVGSCCILPEIPRFLLNIRKYITVGFEAFTAVMFQVEICWVVTPRSVVVQWNMLPPSSR
jgi:hypothetical protein